MAMKQTFSFVKLSLFFLLLTLLLTRGLIGQYSVDELKAAYLEKFALFIKWPENSTLSALKNPFIIGVIKDKSFSAILKKVYRNQKIQNRKVKINYFPNLKSIEGCNILISHGSDEGEFLFILSRFGKKPVLIISDSEGSAEKGIHINFFLEHRKLKFEINPDALKRSGLKASYQLMQLAKLVKTKGESK